MYLFPFFRIDAPSLLIFSYNDNICNGLMLTSYLSLTQAHILQLSVKSYFF